MQNDWFEWHDEKARSNVRDHGVTFEDASLAFDDPDSIDEIDISMDYGEERWKLIGMSAGRLLVVIHTPRGERTRIISARGAEKHERRDYDRKGR